MLEMRPNSERCDANVAPEVSGIVIRSVERPFRADCANGSLGGARSNFHGELVSRPARAGAGPATFPAFLRRVARR